MTSPTEALKMAIEQMNIYAHMYLCEHQCEDIELLDVINACKEALESQEATTENSSLVQEPVAWMMVHRPPHEGAAYLTFDKPTREQKISHHPYELYTHPASSQEQEPVAIKNANGITLKLGWDDLQDGTKLYTHPAQNGTSPFGAKRQLSDDEIAEIHWNLNIGKRNVEFVEFARAIEAHIRGEQNAV